MAACFVVVVAGLRLGATMLLPFALALFLAVMSMPIMFWLQLRRVPAPLAVLLTMPVPEDGLEAEEGRFGQTPAVIAAVTFPRCPPHVADLA